jgi:hypothetical protein
LHICHKRQQVQGYLLDEIYARGAHQSIELRAIRQGGEGPAQAALSIAKEVALASEAGPPSEDGQGDTSLSERAAWGAGLFLGGRDWQKSSTMT